jgi:hypothetical protein
MVTKEECLLDQLLNGLEYDRNEKLQRYIINIYNEGKKYVSEMVFPNDENGVIQALQGWGEAEICKILYETLGDFDTSAPFFTVDYKLNSIDVDDFVRMLTPEDKQKLMRSDIFEELDGTEITDALDSFVQANYPQIYNSIDLDLLYDMGYRTEYSILEADWNQLVRELQQYQPREGLSEVKTVRLNESDLRKMTNKILNEVLKRK